MHEVLYFLISILFLFPLPLFAQPAPQPAAHASMRLGLMGGYTNDSPLVRVEYRYLAHDLLDPSVEKPDHVTVEMGKLRASYLTRPSNLRVDELTVISVMALPPLNGEGETGQFSWKLRLGADTVRDAGCDHCVATTIESGIGACLQVPGAPLFGYATADVAPAISPRFENIVRIGVGGTVGARLYVTPRLAAHVFGRYWYEIFTPKHDSYAYGAEARWAFLRQLALNVKAVRFSDGWESTGGLYYYF